MPISNKFSMIFKMFSIIWEQHQILYSIICLNFIYMMNNFFFRKVTTNIFLHHKAMLPNIHILLMRMIGRILHKISQTFFYTFNFEFIVTFFRTKFSSTISKTMWLRIKSFSTFKTGFTNTCFIPFKETFSRASFLRIFKCPKILFTFQTDLCIKFRHILTSVYNGILFGLSYHNIIRCQ